MKFDVLVIGGGAAGFYGAIQIAQADASLGIGILERGREVLSKVKVSGGGRCNVTHADSEPGIFALNYPRGGKELLGPLHFHGAGDIVSFFEKQGVSLKIEGDGRVFPTTDSSQTIIDCFMGELSRLGIRLFRNCPVTNISPLSPQAGLPGGGWQVHTLKESYKAKRLLLATGSNPKMWHILKNLGHTIIPPVPSLFTFNIRDERLSGLQGVSSRARISLLPRSPQYPKITVSLKSQHPPLPVLETEGPVLITHWGLSGPAVLKLSSWGARVLSEYYYKFQIRLNWLPEYHPNAVRSQLSEIREIEAKKTVLRTHAFDLPRRLWSRIVQASNIPPDLKWANLSKKQIQELTDQLSRAEFSVDGKSTFKEEFVTAGGIDLREINFRTFESKLHPNLYFAGEILNIDALTGGFNFQSAWTGAYLAAQAIAESVQTKE